MINEHQDRLDRLAARRAAASRGTTPNEGLTIRESDPGRLRYPARGAGADALGICTA